MAGIFTSVFARSFRGATASCRPFAGATPFSTAARPASRILQQTHMTFPRPRTFTNTAVATKTAPAKASSFWRAAGVGALGLSLLSLGTPKGAGIPEVRCEAPPRAEPLPPPPSSSVKPYELTFGTVCGICAGVFIKKGAKALAFMLGGVFVLLQYLGASSLVKVDWAIAARRFQSLFYTSGTDPMTGMKTSSAPTLPSVWSRLVNFLTVDFQQRASFVAGLALGLRIG